METRKSSSWWSLVLAIIACLSSGGVNAILTCGQCEKGTTLTCPNSLYMKYEVKLLQYNKDPEGSLFLKCDYITPNLNFTWLEDCDFPSVQLVRIQTCPLFSESIGNVLQQIGVIPENVKHIVWESSHSVESGLQSHHLDGLSNLITLQIQSNYFTSIPNEFLKHSPSLQRLVLNENSLPELPEDFFSYTPNLTSVELGNNRLTTLPDNLLVNLPSLVVFTLRGNALSFLPKNIFSNNPGLQIADLSSNGLQSIEDGAFANLKKLHTFDFRLNYFETLEENVFSGCTNLSVLYLTNNKITHLPSKIFHGTKLKLVYIGYNKLLSIDGLFRDLPTLQNVTLHKNQIGELPSDTFKGSQNLVRLDFQFNSITSLGEGIFDGMSKLRMMLLNNNAIDKVPPGLFIDCISLLQVYMQQNKISEIPFNTFSDQSKIVLLNLSKNNLTLNNSFFNPLNKLTSIERVYLSHNKIKEISRDFLYIFTKLKLLDLNHNLLSMLQSSDLNFLSSNVTLLLQNNNISSIRTDANLGFLVNKKTLSISLSGNPLSCDCYMFEFIKFAQLTRPFPMNEQFNLLVQDAPESLCSSPQNMYQVSLDNVDKTKLVCDFPCAEECSCLIRQYDKALLMDCSDAMITTSPTFTEEYDSFYKNFDLSLDLSRNELDNVDFLGGAYFSHLVNLTLANNSLSSLNESLLPPQLAVLDIRDNNFTSLSQDFVNYLNQTKINVYLGRNPWWCDCMLQSFYEFIRDNFERVIDRTLVLCAENEAPVQELTLEQLCPLLGQPAALGSIAAAVLILLLAAILVTAAWYRHKELIKVWLYTHNTCLWAVTEQEIDADKQYDAFVSYSYKDESFVNNTLVPGLESGDPPYKVCLHYRDWVPGEFIADQIMSSVKASRRTIVVLSKNFLESVWGQMEFKAAHRQALKDKTNRIIVIVYGDVPEQGELEEDLKIYVNTKTYLKWGDQRFWERLRYAMPHAKYAKYIKRNQVDKLEMVKPAPDTEIKTLDEANIKTVDA